MRKISVILIIAIMLILVPATNVYAESVSKIGEVKEMYDGELMRIKLYSDGGFENVRLIGVDTKASEEAFKFIKDFVQQTPLIIYVYTDEKGQVQRDEYGFAYAKIKNVTTGCLNEELISLGLASINEEHKELAGYSQLKSLYDYAVENNVGIHGDGSKVNPYAKKVNLNLASATEMHEILVDLDESVSQKIFNYAHYNKLNNFSELKFIDPSLDNEWIELNVKKMTLVTNINVAEEFELKSLFASSTDDRLAEDLVDYRLQKPFTKVSEIKEINGITDKVYEKVEPFISLNYERIYKDAEDLHVVNINTASQSQLEAVSGITETVAKRIVKYRYDNKYDYKSKEELLYLPNPLDPKTFNELEDNLVIETNINTANKKELESLFGKLSISSTTRKQYAEKIIEKRPFSKKTYVSYYIPKNIYAAIESYIHIGEPESIEKLNVNVATTEQLEDYLGITEKEAEKITKYTKYHTLNYYGELHQKVNVSESNSYITLYTNLNTASREELMLLHKDMKKDLIDAIIEYREERPFANKEEAAIFFKKHKKSHVYNSFKDYVVFR